MSKQEINSIITKCATIVASFVYKENKIRYVRVIMLTILLLWIVSLQFVAINIPGTNSHSIGSVALDRWQMNRVNRIEIHEFGEIIVTIYDGRFINRFTHRTMVAKAAGFNSMFGRYTVLLFRDDTLVRKMDLCELHPQIRVYHQSPKHRFFWTSNLLSHSICCGGGLVEVPRRFMDEIWQMIYER